MDLNISPCVFLVCTTAGSSDKYICKDTEQRKFVCCQSSTITAIVALFLVQNTSKVIKVIFPVSFSSVHHHL